MSSHPIPHSLGDKLGDNELAEASVRRPEKALTAQFVKTVKDAGKYFDGHGLFLRVLSNGSKQWVQRITIRGKRCELGLGNPALVPLAEARQTALENRKLARSGGDPMQAKKDAQAVLTFAEAAQRVYELHRPTWRNEKHAKQFVSTLETYAFPRIGKVKVADVTTADVLAVLTPIWTTKPETARRVKQRLGTVLKWAVAQGWRQDNPAEAINQALPKHDRTKAQRKALPYKEVASCISSVQSSNAGMATKLAFELLVLTATRSGEVRHAVWSEFDLVNAEWVIPVTRMKAKKEHRIPLCDRALKLLEQAKALGDTDLVFEGTKRGKALSDATMSKLVKELGFDVDVHGFRTSFRTWTQEQTNFPREVAEAALAHTIKDKAEAAYARSDLFEKRRMMMDAWAAFLTLDGTATVVHLNG
ncbi:integrase arm-type DNA-binding domain-containing protein [Yoonia sp. I 8.24]|uniref:tyrosine-type recombinase/integrase n=1 Tax=Yoonia sp. I 8.24 TaxID=1537229 RepID=UPI001EE07DD7|nr:integrase arm-type DNA-binding domain-containing protein [Yoonia sp. I 8.24]MCG3267904.1 tyrosine-type recombinase/integrase [Yoonia sp. I 8.24]